MFTPLQVADFSGSSDEEEVEETSDDQVRDFYEREKRVVIAQHYREKFTGAQTEAELNEIVQALKVSL